MLRWKMYVDITFFFFKQKTAYEMRMSDWSSDVCSSDLGDSALAIFCSTPVAPEAPPMPKNCTSDAGNRMIDEAKIGGITPDMLSFSGRCCVCAAKILRPCWRRA